MVQASDAEVAAVDLALVAYRDEGAWLVQELPRSALDDVESIAKELRRYPGETGALAMLSIDEDFVLLVRVQRHLVRVLLSDASAAGDWSLAYSAVEHLGLPVEDDDEMPAGDLAIVSDLGLPAQDLGELLDDPDLYPDEILGEIAGALGFGERYDELAESDE